MTVLITGAGGWIGTRLVDRLSSGRSIAGLSRSELDCAQRAEVDEALRSTRPTTIVHLAGSTAQRLDPKATEPHWRDTLQAGRTILEGAAAAGVAHVVMAGTMEELGNTGGVLTPDLPAKPVTLYGLCKSLLREAAAFYAKTTPMRIDWFRPSTAYGPGQRGPMLIPSACEAALTGKTMRFTDGTQKRDFIFIDDLLDWLTLAVDSQPAANADLNVHHIGSGVGVAVADVIAYIAETLPSARFEIGALPRRPQEPPIQVAPDRPSEDPILGNWRAKTSWRDGLQQTTTWWSSVAE